MESNNMPNTSIPEITIHNVETGEIITRPLNDDELAQLEIDKANAAAQAAAKTKAESDKAALLARLGLTEEELQTILG
jgi:hypothetical protein